MIINPIYDTNDPSFRQDAQTAINILDATFTANITVNIKIGFGDYNGTTLQNQNISEGNVNLVYGYTYGQVRNFLLNASDPGFFNATNLPNTASINGISNFWISSAQARIFGQLPANASATDIDGFVGIGTGFSAGAVRISAFLHEIGHALARVPENVTINNTLYYSNLDLWRFISQGNHLFNGSTQGGVQAAYFSLDNGVTDLADWGQNSDPSDFRGPGSNPPSNLTPNDPFNEIVGNLGNLTNTDILLMDALGFRHTHIGPDVVVGAGDFNSNGNPDFTWNNSGFMSMWEYNPTAQTVTNTALGNVPGWAVLGSAHFNNVNGTSGTTTQMLMDYVPTGTMTLWWANNGGQLTGVPVGSSQNQNWASIGLIGVGQFLPSNITAGINDFVVFNGTDRHLYDWWINSQNQLTGIDITAISHVPWTNVGLVAAAQFTANGGTNMLVNNVVDHHLYDWWINSNATLSGVDLGPYWTNVALVGVGQFTANFGANLLVTNTVDHHLYDWWITQQNQLTGIDLTATTGIPWAGVALVTAGRFDSNTTNTELLVQNTGDHHLYEWWITSQGKLSGIDLGPVWANVQLIGNSHYNNNSANNELLVRNTTDGHFYEWWISGNALHGVDLGGVPGGVAGDPSAGAVGNAGDFTSAGMSSLGTSMAAMGSSGVPAPAGLMPPADPTGAASGMSSSLMVQAMASFGASNAAVGPNGALASIDPAQQPTLAATADPHLAHA